MKVKEKVLFLLEEKKGEYATAESIAHSLGVTQLAVKKAVDILRGEGYGIYTEASKGYALFPGNDARLADSIEKNLLFAADKVKMFVYDTLPSTNTEAKRRALEGAQEGVVVAALAQTEGRGRHGRSFFSPPDSGIYMSAVLRPYLPLQNALLITTAAAVASAEAIEEVCKRKTNIKWVNDVYIDRKKVCGILTEASVSAENGNLDYAVLGIGINVFEPKSGFPPELKDVASGILGSESGNVKSRLAAAVLDKFFTYYENLTQKKYLEAYRSRLLFVGEKVRILRGLSEREAEILGIDDNFSLLVRFQDNSVEALDSGEISVVFSSK
ncbi:MAG: biotin--[acetyl-CoA-carboxylase] ligase [Clostridia bacterium]|nr:biotin--[acetyl-CoA-carboxylase] ligase [Clostridia bacterium]